MAIALETWPVVSTACAIIAEYRGQNPMYSLRIFLASTALLVTPASACKIAWPDANIPIPEEVRAFIGSECHEFHGWSEETLDECISGERYGYCAVVTILMNQELGKKAAERYRGCATGLGRLGGKYHRRKAECVSAALGLRWRFSYSRETSLPSIRKAGRVIPRTPSERQRALEFAMSVME
mgnify:FL=1